jgi:hypothetical protein
MEKEDRKQLTKYHYIIITICVFIGLSIFRYFYRSQNNNSEIEMDKSSIIVDGKQYEVQTPSEQKIDEETLKQLLNDPETKEFLDQKD